MPYFSAISLLAGLSIAAPKIAIFLEDDFLNAAIVEVRDVIYIQ